jgi:aldehyde:ferredoxin oxidoreductase
VLALPRFSLVAKSPLSGGIAESRVEGPFGPALRDTGNDAVVLTGRAGAPSSVLVEPGRTRVLDATDLWGLVSAATDRLQVRHGPSAHVAAIGPEGEHLVRFAAVVTDRGYAAARMRLGAVLGAKNCNAVVVAGEEPVATHPTALARLTGDRLTRSACQRSSVPGVTTAAGDGSWRVSGPER